jgi:microcompartment protein CcmL/EutN
MIEAIGVLEIDSIAAGVEVADAVVKMAPVRFVDAFMTTPGKYVVLLHGDPSSVDSGLRAGREVAGAALLDWLHLPFVHQQVLPAIRNQADVHRMDAVGLVETSSVASGVGAADAAAKAAEVHLVHLQLGRGIGGKSMLLLTGDLPDVQAAVEAASRVAREAGRLVAERVIAQPHPDLAGRLRAGLRHAGGPETAPVADGDGTGSAPEGAARAPDAS